MKHLKGHIPLSLVVILGLVFSAGARAYFADPTASGEPVLHLGKIEVTGQQNVMEVLQTIKVALKRSESSDPSQQNSIVCRIEKNIGSHQQDTLTCATNRTLSLRRQTTQNGIITACEGVEGTSCLPDQGFGGRSPLNAALQASDGHVLHMPVNAASLRNLLSKIPDAPPERNAAPEAGTVPVPVASSSND